MPKARARETKTRPSPPPTGPELETVQELGDRFDEACEEARQRREHADISLGPTVPVPMARLRPGCLAWSREIRVGVGRALLYYAIEPAEGGGAGALPITDVGRGKLACNLPTSGSPAARLIGVATSDPFPKGFAAFVDTVLAKLQSDSG
jgi:hypothetical protein